MEKTALLVVDVQVGLLADNPYQKERFTHSIETLLEKCRVDGMEVIHVQHSDNPDGELAPGSPAWEIADFAKPLPGEYVLEKRFNNAFHETGLLCYLLSLGIQQIILVGMQTEYCIDATCKSAFEHGFRVLIPEEANTTFDNAGIPAQRLHNLFNRHIWDGRAATCMTMEALLGKWDLL